MLSRSTKEQRSMIRRLFACHTVPGATKSTGLMKRIRKKFRRSLDTVRRNSNHAALLVTEATSGAFTTVVPQTPTGAAAQGPSVWTLSADRSAVPGYPARDIMPKCPAKNMKNATVTFTPRSAATNAAAPTTAYIRSRQRRSHSDPDVKVSQDLPPLPSPSSAEPTRAHTPKTPRNLGQSKARKAVMCSVAPTVTPRQLPLRAPKVAVPKCEPSAPPIEEMPDDDISGWISEKDSSQDTQSGYLTANESFDLIELQRRVEQLKIGERVLSPHVDDGQLRKVRRLTDAQLKAELRKVGIVAGPMCARSLFASISLLIIFIINVYITRLKIVRLHLTPSSFYLVVLCFVDILSRLILVTISCPLSLTRGMYEKKLVAMRRGAAEVKGVRYSRQLELAMLDEVSAADRGKKLDDQIREEFQLAGVSAFCYLLLDPRKIHVDVDTLDLRSFVPAIFYVGKGTKARPLAHLIEAKKEKEAKSPKITSNKKLQRIDSIWENGRGVVCLQINHSVSDDEAFVREAALIEAIKLDNLTNLKGGEWRGSSKSWTMAMRAEFGTYQLLRAMGVLKMEGIRPIFPQALPETLYPFAQKKNT
ncbi:hypothetical protein Q1695_008205 [Nippostrongylus brasiliensis]|nr:hypothetical protein Q1695_008205 [Nippostrongylus brasiliensis]